MPVRRLFVHLETLFLVTLISVLVWLYAEGAMVRSYPRQRVAVDFTGPAGGRLAIEPEQTSAFVSFRGSAAQLQELRARLAGGPIEIPVRAGGEPLQEVELAERLDQLLFTPMGLVIDEVEPERMAVRVRRFATREVPVQVVADGLALREAAAASPATARITLPEDRVGLLERLGPVAQLTAQLAEGAGPAGEAAVLTLPLTLPEALLEAGAELETDAADVSFTLAAPESTLTLDAIPLRQLTPLNFAYEIVVANGEKVLRDVTLVGPPATLARIREGDPAHPVWAEIQLTDAASLTEGSRVVPVIVRTGGRTGVTASGLRNLEVQLVRKP
ncbi:YbbR-like domain-containing protein [Phycisphaera mikurensis]|uniref:YbbR family protein n=1 Tax=Phycisphaera mikurensis (strain NBRC 102666 / KCTC 22515 / FYK2301M01) TaxID=1142394 RepID=I0IG64_PHYMF|nr:hypothetical protein [Phycisphaera mikurensis]MBB6440365.1 hypothetical protein [Phycisphaera mikurensis]BAM04252.1 hypothetical protein PSMK_20930 [Phycisphaera mikurensis NBRC 102666]